jgi:hypothetical protein
MMAGNLSSVGYKTALHMVHAPNLEDMVLLLSANTCQAKPTAVRWQCAVPAPPAHLLACSPPAAD